MFVIRTFTILSFLLFIHLNSFGIGFSGYTLIEKSQVPNIFKDLSPDEVYLFAMQSLKTPGIINNKITDLPLYLTHLNSVEKYIGYRPRYRLIFFKHRNQPVELMEFDISFKKTFHVYVSGNRYLDVRLIGPDAKEYRRIIVEVQSKLITSKAKSLSDFLRYDNIYDDDDFNRPFGKVWMISVQPKAISDEEKHKLNGFQDYCKKSFEKIYPWLKTDSLFYGITLSGSEADKKNILKHLQFVLDNANYDDIFIFDFDGYLDSTATPSGGKKYNLATSRSVSSLSLPDLQSFLQQIQANNQLFIFNNVGTSRFLSNFIQGGISGSLNNASLLNKNKVIISKGTYYQVYGEKSYSLHDLINLTPHPFNIFNLLFGKNLSIDAAIRLQAKQTELQIRPSEYIDVFSQQMYLERYNQIIKKEAVVNSADQATSQADKGKKYALIVATDNYSSSNDWPKLNNTISDAKSIASELEIGYGYTCKSLYDKPADSILTAITLLRSQLKKDDELILYIAGHGYFDRQILNDAFAVCSDSKSLAVDKGLSSMIQFNKLRGMIDVMPANHILVILDMCYSGAFDEQILTRGMSFDPVNKNIDRIIAENRHNVVRKLLTSAKLNLSSDGQRGKHSPFANQLLQILRSRGSGNNGLISFTDICSVMNSASQVENDELKFTPQFNSFGRDQGIGNYYFIPLKTQVPHSN